MTIAAVTTNNAGKPCYVCVNQPNKCHGVGWADAPGECLHCAHEREYPRDTTALLASQGWELLSLSPPMALARGVRVTLGERALVRERHEPRAGGWIPVASPVPASGLDGLWLWCRYLADNSPLSEAKRKARFADVLFLRLSEGASR